MTDDEIDAKAREALDRWYRVGGDFEPNWRRSLAQVISIALRDAVKAEREACAGLMDQRRQEYEAFAANPENGDEAEMLSAATLYRGAAYSIRARSTPIAQVVQPKLNT